MKFDTSLQGDRFLFMDGEVIWYYRPAGNTPYPNTLWITPGAKKEFNLKTEKDILNFIFHNEKILD